MEYALPAGSQKHPKSSLRREASQGQYAKIANDPTIESTMYLTDNKALFAPYLKKQRDRVVAIVNEAKSKPCADCGVQYPSYVMDLDHLEAKDERFAGVCQMAHECKSGWQVSKEIEKCEVVCSNCHRERTHQRRIMALSSKG